jgi:retinoid hydroxylase
MSVELREVWGAVGGGGDERLRDIPGSASPLELVHLLRDARRFFHERFDRHGRIWKTRLGYPVVFLIGEEANRTVLVTGRRELSFGLGYAQTAVDRIFEGSIMLQDGDAHQKTRDALTPAVGMLAVRESQDAVRAIWDRAADALAPGRPEDVYTLSQRTTFSVAANVLTGLALGDEAERLRPPFERLIEGIMAPTKVRVPFGRLDRALRARAELFELLLPRVEAARGRPPAGLIGHLAHQRDERGELVDPRAVVGHLLLLLWAGYDTTASSGSWLLYELAQRPEWQEQLRAELAAGGDLASGAEVPLLNAFLMEAERMYPSALFFPRIAVTDFEFGGHVIPRGTPTFYSPYMSHRDPAAFPNPNAFDPGRWLPARGAAKASPAKLVGFGGGPRICLGKTFAKLQLRVAVDVLLRRFRIEPDPRCRSSVLALPVHHPVDARVLFTPLAS